MDEAIAQTPWDRPVGGASTARRRRLRLAVTSLSVIAHALVLLVFVSRRIESPVFVEPEPVQVTLVAYRDLTPGTEAPAAAPVKAPEVKPPPRRERIKPPPPPIVKARYVPRTPPAPVRSHSDADALAAMGLTAGGEGSGEGTGSGGSGGVCDMRRFLQASLQKDRQVMDAVTQRVRNGQASAIPVWHGEWIRSGEEDGEGLAVIREALIMSIFSAPEACRSELMHGPAVLRLSNSGVTARLALGASNWRWSDLLMARGVAGH